MSANFAHAPHQGRTPPQGAPNAALLIDFDNVTMGIRSDLMKELKNLLNSDIIKGKVAVQRAYADWRRYPQYIVPLSEASVDLIFAPAYGSSKKNATDIRLAIDALELVFTRPEIGTFILLSGDSDFSSMVLKLKEYGKYVVGVGIRESSSDLLVQNCDEYYSYTALGGLMKGGEESADKEDPWVLVERAVRQMSENGDVMRSDRLKQVILELDPAFDEKELGFSKYNRFLSEAASRGCISLRKMDNGQYEVMPADGTPKSEEPESGRGRSERSRDRGRGRGRDRRESRDTRDSRGEEKRGGEARGEVSAEKPREKPAEKPEQEMSTAQKPTRDRARSLEDAYALLRDAVSRLSAERGGAARDSDVKRRMLEIQADFDESEFGFPKFSRFLRQAHDAEVIDLRRGENGAYDVELPGGTPEQPRGGAGRSGRERGGREEKRRESTPEPKAEQAEPKAEKAEPKREEADTRADKQEPKAEQAEARTEKAEPKAGADEPESGADEPESAATAAESEKPAKPSASTKSPRRNVRTGRRGGGAEEPPPLLPGQVVSLGGRTGGTGAAAGPDDEEEGPRGTAATHAATGPGGDDDSGAGDGADTPVAELGLPRDRDSVVNYLQNSYKGVGLKTAESLIDAFGAENVFEVLQDDPSRVEETLGGRRATAVLEGWQADYERRTGRSESGGEGSSQPSGNGEGARPRSGRGGRGRRGGRNRRRGGSSQGSEGGASS